MRDAPGVGLAAPQVGISLQIAVIEDREEILQDLPPEELVEKDRHPVPFHVIINPKIAFSENDKISFYEGCLSVAGFSAVVPRARVVHVDYLDEQGEQRSVDATGWYARILQHEIDHLNGTLYIDRMESRTFTTRESFEARTIPFRQAIRDYIHREARPVEKFGHQVRLYALTQQVGAGLEYDD